MPISPLQSSRVILVIVGFLLTITLACTGLSETSKLPETPEETRQILTVLPTQTEQSLEEPRVEEEESSVEKLVVDRTYCDNAEKKHPVGESIARNYDVLYKDVIDIYCEGYTFDEILLALETESQTGMDKLDILQMRDDGLSWDEIWNNLDLIP